MRIQAAVLHRTGAPLEIETLELAPPGPREVTVRMASVGVCRSDWHVMVGDTRHPLPVVLGHEGAGVVTEVGPEVDDLAVGDHVTLNWAPACGTCFYCAIGRPNLCSTYKAAVWEGTMLDGTTRLARNGQNVFHYCGLACFADHVVVGRPSCVRIDPALPLPVAALIGCSVTTGVGAVLNTAGVEPGSSVAVFGAGGVGLSVILGARLAAARQIIAVDPVPRKLELARQCGATHTVTADATCIDKVRELTEDRGADYVFEAVGMPKVQEQCLEATRPGGTVVLAGLAPMGSRTTFPADLITRQEKSILGCYYGTCDPARDFPCIAHFYLDGKLDLDRLITHSYRLSQINEAFAAMHAGETARGLVRFDG